jgi:hypothetical protein
MNKLFIATALVCLFALGAFAQKSADLSGKWNLDLTKSDLGQQAAMIKSQTVTITQSGTSFKVSTATERNTPPDSAGGGGGGMGGGRGGFGGGGDQSYTLDGKEVSTERQTPNGNVTIKTTASQSGNKVVVSSVFPGPNGDVKSTTTYELSGDGKTLTVTRESTRGTSKSVYTKG